MLFIQFFKFYGNQDIYLSMHFIYRMSDNIKPAGYDSDGKPYFKEPSLPMPPPVPTMPAPPLTPENTTEAATNDAAVESATAMDTIIDDAAADAEIFEKAKALSTTYAAADTKNASLLGNYINPDLVKITATKGENPSIVGIETNGEEFSVNIPVAGTSAPRELTNAIQYGKDYKEKSNNAIPTSTDKPGFFNKMGRMFRKNTSKVTPSGGRIGYTKKNRKRRITRSNNRKKARPSRRR